MTHYEASYYDAELNLLDDSYLFEADTIAEALTLAAAHIHNIEHSDVIASVTVQMYEENDNHLPEAA